MKGYSCALKAAFVHALTCFKLFGHGEDLKLGMRQLASSIMDIEARASHKG